MEEIMIKQDIDPKKIIKIADVLKAIAHPARLQVLEQLHLHGPMSVSEIVEKINIEQSLLSHHLSKMKDKGILNATRDGKNIYYEVADKELPKIFECINNCDLI